MLLKTIFLTISSLIAIASAQCPSYWWPMSPATASVNFFSEVMRGDNIQQYVGPTLAASSLVLLDRTTKYLTITLAATQTMTAAADAYFCNGAFSIALFLRYTADAAAAATIVDFKDVNSAGVQFNLASTTSLSLVITGTTATSAAISTPSAGTWNFVVVTYSGAGSVPAFYFTNNLATLSTLTTNPANTAIAIAPTCTSMVKSFIGSTVTGTQVVLGSMNDLKIYNFGLSATQVAARYAAELCKFF
jgi:hypothetical protein